MIGDERYYFVVRWFAEAAICIHREKNLKNQRWIHG